MSSWVVSKRHIDEIVRWATGLPEHSAVYAEPLTGGAADMSGRQVERERLTREVADELGRLLWTENVRGVAYRYQDSDNLPGPNGFNVEEAMSYTLDLAPAPRTANAPEPGKLYSLAGIANGQSWQESQASQRTPVEIMKACDCLEYQSCDREGYYDSQAYRTLRAIREVASCMVPGYDAAPWGFD